VSDAPDRPGVMDETNVDPSASRPIYSIGAVARMLGVETATLRVWEERYGVVVPARSKGSQRLYSRDQVDHLRYVVHMMADGTSAADAHRLLEERLGSSPDVTSRAEQDILMMILLAERDRYAAELCEYFLRTEGYDVCLAWDRSEAERVFADRQPNLSVVDLMMSGGGLELCRTLAGDERAPVLALSPLPLQDDALAAGASAFLQKPIEPLQFVSTVRDLLGSSALTRREPGAAP
jgi:DNA-binding transcriptional MerR regulator